LALGLFGGSFNPIHYGHLAIAHGAREALRLDRILFIPTGTPPHKTDSGLAPAADRFEMVRVAIDGIEPFSVSDIEMSRPGKSYSIDTVRVLQKEYGESTGLYFLIGLDAFVDLPSWKEPEALLRLCRFVVISRPGQSYRSLAGVTLLHAPPLALLAELDAGHRTRVDIAFPGGPGLICLSLPPNPISASDIRQRVRRAEPLANLLPPQVESYILQHRLYQEDPDRTHIQGDRPCHRKGDARQESP
jgi:nicotinate-nucleotide adenylyltransferase